MTGPTRLLAVALAAAALLAACGGDDDEQTTVTVTETETVTGPETTPSPETTPEESGRDGEPLPADEEVDELAGFSSPSGNIGCYISPESVRCDIAERDWEPPPKPADCELDFGQGIEMPAGGFPRFVCAGDTALGAERLLAYGSSISAGLLRCESSERGIRCQDAESGAGFLLSRERFELF